MIIRKLLIQSWSGLPKSDKKLKIITAKWISANRIRWWISSIFQILYFVKYQQFRKRIFSRELQKWTQIFSDDNSIRIFNRRNLTIVKMEKIMIAPEELASVFSSYQDLNLIREVEPIGRCYI